MKCSRCEQIERWRDREWATAAEHDEVVKKRDHKLTPYGVHGHTFRPVAGPAEEATQSERHNLK